MNLQKIISKFNSTLLNKLVLPSIYIIDDIKNWIEKVKDSVTGVGKVNFDTLPKESELLNLPYDPTYVNYNSFEWCSVYMYKCIEYVQLSRIKKNESSKLMMKSWGTKTFNDVFEENILARTKFSYTMCDDIFYQMAKDETNIFNEYIYKNMSECLDYLNTKYDNAKLLGFLTYIKLSVWINPPDVDYDNGAAPTTTQAPSYKTEGEV